MSRRFLIAALSIAVAGLAAIPAPAAVTAGHSGWEWGSPTPQGQTIKALEFEGARGYAAGFFGTLLSTDDGGATWSGADTGLTEPLQRISLIDADSVVIAGECAVRRSDDGGQSFTRLPWTATDLRCSSKVAAFDFPTDQTGYLVLEDGSVLSTADGGRTWSRKTSVPVTGTGGIQYAPVDVSFLTEQIGIAASRSGRLYRTTDGGSSWSLVYGGTGALAAVHFVTPLVGYAVGSAGIVLRTENAGVTWVQRPSPGVISLQGIRCGTALTCVATTDTPMVLRTLDGSETWSAVTPSTQKVMAAAFSSPTRVVAAGEAGATVVSDDSGATWSPVGKRLSATFERLRALNSTVVFATGSSGALARSDDGGVTWSEVGVSTSEDVIDVSFSTPSTGYVLDAAGTLLRTDNSGQSWQILNTGTASHPQAVLALGDTVLLVGPKGVLRSIDGGGTFNRVRGRLLSRSRLFNIDRGAGSVFVYGSKNILVSKTAGRTWQKVRLPRKTLIQAVDFVSPRTGFALGQDGQVFKTRNRGDRWLDLSGVGTDDATGLSFSTATHGYLTLKRFGSDPHGHVLRTTDGGRTWRPQLVSTDEPSAEGIVATGPSGAFLLADSRTLLFTTSGGDRGDSSKVTLRTTRRTVRRRAVIRISGRVSGAKGGAQVVISRRERGERGWVSRTATVASNGTFSTNWKLVKTAAFVAQWAGDENNAGDGSVPLVVKTRRR